MSPDEVTLWIEGYERRQDELGEMWALFTSHNINKDRKRGKQVKPRQLWHNRRDEVAKVVDLEDRRWAMEAFKTAGGPKGRVARASTKAAQNQPQE